MAEVRTAESDLQRDTAVLRTHRDGSPNTECVGLMSSALIKWETVSSRTVTAKINTKKSNSIQCYASNNEADDEKVNDFH